MCVGVSSAGSHTADAKIAGPQRNGDCLRRSLGDGDRIFRVVFIFASFKNIITSSWLRWLRWEGRSTTSEAPQLWVGKTDGPALHRRLGGKPRVVPTVAPADHTPKSPPAYRRSRTEPAPPGRPPKPHSAASRRGI